MTPHEHAKTALKYVRNAGVVQTDAVRRFAPYGIDSFDDRAVDYMSDIGQETCR